MFIEIGAYKGIAVTPLKDNIIKYFRFDVNPILNAPSLSTSYFISAYALVGSYISIRVSSYPSVAMQKTYFSSLLILTVHTHPPIHTKDN